MKLTYPAEDEHKKGKKLRRTEKSRNDSAQGSAARRAIWTAMAFSGMQPAGHVLAP